MSNDVFTPESLADRWGCSEKTVERMLVSGKLHGFKVGNLWRISASEVQKYEGGNYTT